jgi:acetyl esterase/lipase
MYKTLAALAILFLACALIYIFIPLKAFNFVIPKDAESQLAASAVHYGPDRDQTLFVYRPTDPGANLPTLIFVHGGSWEEGNAADYEFVGRAFAAKGFLTLVINYRARPSHAYPAFIEDVAVATAWANAHAADFGGDGKTIFLVGHSAGAYNIAMAILNQTYLQAAGVDQTSIKGIATLAGPFDFLPFDSPISQATFGAEPDPISTQPVSFVRKDAPPFLILHDGDDTLVSPTNAASLYKHLTDVGAPAQHKVYPNTNHVGIMLDMAKPLRSRAPVLEDVVQFFKSILAQNSSG